MSGIGTAASAIGGHVPRNSTSSTINSPLKSKNSALLRYTLGLNVILEGSVRLKLSGEFYDFTDFKDEVAVNLGVAAAF